MSKTIPSRDLRDAKLRANPTCVTCGETKKFEDFPRNAVDYSCLTCRGKYAIRKYHEKRSKMTAEELAELKRKINERQTRRRNERLAAMSERELAKFKDRVNAENLKRRNEVRDEVYRAYGGYKCSCCGETERAFLSVDHVNNDGAAHKKAFNLKTGEQMYRWLKRNNFPAGFQILCMNCNWGKRNNKGICPHQSSKV